MKKYNILIVEDEIVNIKFIERAILELGYTLMGSVQTAHEAIELCQKEEVHVIFMDINLKGPIDGITCAKKINKHKTIPIIYTTSFSDSETIDEAMESNLFGYLIKPFDLKDLEVVLSLTIKQNYCNKKMTLDKTTSLVLELPENYRFHSENKILFKNEEVVSLTKKELDVFDELVKNFNQPVTFNMLLSSVWKNKEVSLSTVRDTILRLRKKLPELTIRTVPSIGYSLVKSK